MILPELEAFDGTDDQRDHGHRPLKPRHHTVEPRSGGLGHPARGARA